MARFGRETRAFLEAILFGDIDKARSHWATNKVDLEAREAGDLTALQTAVCMGQQEIVEWLISIGADVNARKTEDFEGEIGREHEATTLMLAADAFNGGANAVPIIRALASAGADLDAKDWHGQTALFYALEYPDRLKLLIELGLDLQATTSDGVRLLMRAKQQQNRAAEEILRSAGASAEGLENVELLEAAAAGNIDRVRALIASGADVNFRSDGTPLAAAAGEAHVEVVSLLLASGADPSLLETDNPHGDFGPLSRAVYGGHLEVAQILVDAGANPAAKNHGYSVLQYAKMGKREGRRPDAPWDALVKLVRRAVQTAAERSGDEGRTALLTSNDLSEEARALLDRFDGQLPKITFRELSGVGTTLLESAPMPTKKAEAAWTKLRGATRAYGWSCFLVAYGLDDVEPERGDIEKDFAEASDEKLDGWLLCRRKDWESYEGDQDPDDDSSLSSRQLYLQGLNEADLVRARPKVRVKESRLAINSKQVRLGLVKGRPGWAPLLYRFGGWNDAPPPAIQAMMINRWHERHGAELACIERDSLQLYVDKELSLEEVRAAAIDVCLFCSESENAADDVRTVSSPVWFFWWD